MNVLRFFQRRSPAPVAEPIGSASAAKDRLKVLLSHERAAVGQSRLVELLREEILAVIAKHVAIDRDKVQIKMDRGETSSTLAIDIEVPAPPAPRSQLELTGPVASDHAALAARIRLNRISRAPAPLSHSIRTGSADPQGTGRGGPHR